MEEIGLVVLGFLLGLLPLYVDRRRRERAHWAALSAEAAICERLARAYLSDGVAAPLYRLPEAAFATSFPALLADGAVGKAEITELAWFWGAVQDINRGLDNANSALSSEQKQLLASEVDRLKLKCRELLEGRGGTEASLAAVRRVLASHAA